MLRKLFLCAGLALTPAYAASPDAAGRFADWRLAVHGTGAARLCYAYTRAHGAAGFSLAVTERASLRDIVSLSAPQAFVVGRQSGLIVGQIKIALYGAGRGFFARDNHAALTGFARGKNAVLPLAASGKISPPVFSLDGFAAALHAARATCPAGNP
jgi:hypothetical protein